MAKKVPPEPFPFRIIIDGDPLGLYPDETPRGRGKGTLPVRWKRNEPGKAYAVVNEWVAGEVAHFLRLPIPPGGVANTGISGHAERFHVAMELDGGFDPLPFSNPDGCLENNPKLCAGILAFDILIANPDRYRRDNLYGGCPPSPKTLWIYDHEQALLGGDEGKGCYRLNLLRDKLGLSHPELTSRDRHLFLGRVARRDDILEWTERIADVPRWFIEEICEECRRLDVTAEEAADLKSFLVHRAARLTDIIRAHGDLIDWEKPGGLFA